MKMLRGTFAAVAVCGALALTSGTAAAQCLPGLQAAIQRYPAVYGPLSQVLLSQVPALTTLLRNTTDQTTYAALLAHAQVIVAAVPNSRMLITLPDGTVVLDTSKNNNTYADFQNKAINENHNSRLAIFAAQEYPCGYGLESKLSSSTGQIEHYVAYRLGAHTDNEGTARLSVRAAAATAVRE